MKKLFAILITAVLLTGTLMTAQAGNDDDKNETNVTNKASLKGQVLDLNTGEALTGVKVNIKGTEVTAYTDFEGTFSVKGLSPGVYEVETSFISYEDKTIDNLKLQVSDKNKVTIRMKSLEE